MIAARRGSPLLIGVKTSKKLKVDFVDVDTEIPEMSKILWVNFFSKYLSNSIRFILADDQKFLSVDEPRVRRTQSRSFLGEDGVPHPVEYILASDASAIIEHTKKVLYLEDDDIAHIQEGGKGVL